ncbi:VWA domain-containing protein [Anaeromyxobacter paludicola]|uniref:VWA containing CoxE family protein n=1 Tax=Anaeromyxobacter paludicola TaxID=2918171 RepID=A0ABN6N5A9_9BACT|nr:VWA domain-containing protein [Anaeromyxobacter paludicola]BDG07263.1 hypothetical protein AMPC_03760 [Anaeromyxobacter paludicola]
MDARLAEFARLLRQNGVRASPSELADAVRAAALTGVAERDDLRAALRATLVKRAADVPTFERLFALYFSGLGRVLDAFERSLEEELSASGLLEPGELEMVAATLRALAPELTPLGRALAAGERAALLRLLRTAALELDFTLLHLPGQVGFYGRRLLSAAGGGGVDGDLARIEEALRARGLSPAGLSLVSARLAAQLSQVADAARRWAELEQEARSREGGALRPDRLAAPSRAEQERIEAAVRRLAERLRAKLALRAHRRRGALDVRRTLRRGLALGGYPARPAFRRRLPERPDLVVLCDLSDSVRHVSRLMLLFLHALQGLFGRVRTFAFVADLGEVTEALRGERDPARAADLATAGKAVNLHGNSNYGRALRAFHARFRGAVTRRTTLLVIGDGRGNYLDPGLDALADLRRRARRVLWICPEERQGWGQGDSEMPAYARAVDRVATVSTLEDLAGVADALVPRG